MEESKDTIVITGGKTLTGTIKLQGAKNEAFQVLAATLLSTEPVTLHNLPDILDVKYFFEILKILGTKITKLEQKGSFTLDASGVTANTMDSVEFIKQFSKLRGSLMISGAMLGRFRTSRLAEPGGDKIGVRPITVHLKGFLDLGAELFGEKITLDIPSEEEITLNEPSVTGTANVILASVLYDGTRSRKIKIYNAACEPYIQQLCKMLNSMGAKISGAGTNRVTIETVESLSGCEHTLDPDMIEMGSLVCLGAVCGGGILLEGAHVSGLGVIMLRILDKFGVTIEQRSEGVYIPPHDELIIKKPTTPGKTIREIYDAPWPGLSPDQLSCLIVMLLYGKGAVTVYQKMFKGRLPFCDPLISMGADIVMSHHQSVTIIGGGMDLRLTGLVMTSPDIRAGMALLIAALAAEGTSTIQNAHQIHRGYENIVERLSKLGANICEE